MVPIPFSANYPDRRMSPSDLARTIDAAWDARDGISTATRGEYRDAVEAALDGMDSGELRVAEQSGGKWQVHQWLKKAVLLSFRLNDMAEISGGPDTAKWWDKVPSKFAGWSSNRFRDAGFRAVPGAIVRRSAYIAPNVVLMPSFVNVGAYVGSGTMVDTWATVGSCAQIGKNCHLSGGGGLGGGVWASRGCWSRWRPSRSSSRTIALSGRAARSSRALSSRRARCWRWAPSS